MAIPPCGLTNQWFESLNHGFAKVHTRDYYGNHYPPTMYGEWLKDLLDRKTLTLESAHIRVDEKKSQLFYLEGMYKKQITLRLFQMEALLKIFFHLSLTFTSQNCLELIKPLRVKAFCWAACLDKILVLYNLKCPKVALLNICFMCWAMDEPINHLFLHCVSTQILVFLGSLFGVFFPLSPSFCSLLEGWFEGPVSD